LNAGIVLPGYKVDRVIRRRDLQDNFGVGACELGQLRQNHHLRSGSRNDESNSACWTLSLLSGFRYGSLDPFQSGSKIVEKCGPGGRGGDASRRPREQLKSHSLFEAPNGMAERRLRDAKPHGRAGKATLFRNNGEC
jgi:hypothetical protein